MQVKGNYSLDLVYLTKRGNPTMIPMLEFKVGCWPEGPKKYDIRDLVGVSNLQYSSQRGSGADRRYLVPNEL